MSEFEMIQQEISIRSSTNCQPPSDDSKTDLLSSQVCGSPTSPEIRNHQHTLRWTSIKLARPDSSLAMVGRKSTSAKSKDPEEPDESEAADGPKPSKKAKKAKNILCGPPDMTFEEIDERVKTIRSEHV